MSARTGCLLLLVLLGTRAGAAPTVTYLTPSGGACGSTVAVTAAGTFDSWPVQVWVSGTGVTATAGKTRGTLSVAISRDAVPGVYYLRCHDATGASNLRPFIVGTLPEVTEKEPNDEPKQPHTLDTSAVVNGRLQKNGDVDCFALTLKKGQTLVASLVANDVLRSPMDAVLQIVSPDGFVLEQNHDYHGLDPQIVYVAPKDGVYVARLFAFPSEPDSGIRFAGGDNYVYRLTLTTAGFADHPLPLAVARTNPGTVLLTGWNLTPELARFTPRITDPKADALTLFHPQVTNSVRVRVEPHATWDATATKPKEPLETPFTLTDRLDRPRTAKTISFTGKKGQALLIEVEAATLGFPLAPVLRVLDATGKQLARVEPAQLHRDVSLPFTPTADGVYQIELRDQHGEGSARHLYRLRVVRPEPDFTLKLPTDRPAIPGTLTLTPVVTRVHGFNEPITLAVENLPPGVTAKIDKLNIVLTAEKQGISGSVRIIGTAKDRTRVAQVDLADLGTTTTDLWLTTTAAPKK